ncbi:MAG: ribosome maturation factor RimP [Bacillota bacterium]|jgi:ribosome maturation factor RimP
MTKKTKKTASNVADLVTHLAEPLVENMGLELVDVEYIKEGSEWFLRLFIDRPNEPIDHQCCQLVSEAVEKVLDEKDPIPHAYYLEVSSPGAERPLKKPADFVRFSGREVQLNLYQNFEGKKVYQGQLLGLTDEKIKLKVDDGEKLFPLDKVSKAFLVVKF